MTARMPALLRSTHPLPTTAVTLVAVVLAISTGLEPWRVALVGLVILANQFSIGLSNDWIDADRDRATGRSDKPVAAGELPVAVARGAAIGCAVASVALSVPLGWQAVLAHLVFLVSGWAYNAVLKRTAFSALPYFTGFAALPVFVGLAAAEPTLVSLWVALAGGLLGVAAHGANVLPDLDDDRATGVTGLPHRIGTIATGALIALSLMAASASLVFGAGLTGVLSLVGFAVTVVLGTVCALLVWLRPPSALVFRLIIVAALIVLAQLVVAGPVA